MPEHQLSKVLARKALHGLGNFFNMEEHWKAIAGYEGLYEVSSLGRVRSLNFNHTGETRILKPGKKRKDHLFVNLYKYGKVKKMFVHRLVASAFIPNPNQMPQVHHKDENPQNNAASNLMWVTNKENCNYGTRNRRLAEALRGRKLSEEHKKKIGEAHINHPKKSKPIQQLDKQGNLLAVFQSIHEATRVTGIWPNHICACCLGKHKSAGGYIWKYLETISQKEENI